MKGLIIKDLIFLKKNGLFLLLLAAAFAIGSSDNILMCVPMMTLMFCVLVVNGIQMDETTHWNSFSLSMPVDRKSVVGSKYLMIAITVLAMVVVGAAITLIMTLMGRMTFSDGITGLLCTLIFGFIYSSAAMPIYFKFDAAKSKIILMVSAGLVGGGAAAIMSGSAESALGALISDAPVLMIVSAAAAVSVVLFVLSYLLSVKVYRSKDL